MIWIIILVAIIGVPYLWYRSRTAEVTKRWKKDKEDAEFMRRLGKDD